jgi:cell division protein FtsB
MAMFESRAGAARPGSVRPDASGRTLPRRLIAIGTGLASIYLLILTGQRALDAYRANQEVQAVRAEIAILRARNIELQQQLASGQLDEDIERTAREELSLAKQGDHPVILMWPPGARPGPSAPGVATPLPEPNWRQWLHLFVDPPPARR